ncbi:sigma-70 family RNA polymerase sigma factor [Alteromonas flava]|uniref:sigma-70 family RNA polymerase sigma factor n=1 Tax=Alteromonas flava TaxID=2048003 RepID=UPI000C28E2EE|nr:sigma-70 family RNA polymerase sigma factor [Alteromonas flava]
MTIKDTNQSLTALINAQYPRLLAALIRMLGSAHIAIAEDLVQDTVERTIKAWHAQAIPSNPPAWMMLTARHLAIDFLRRQSTKRMLADSLVHSLLSEWTLEGVVDANLNQDLLADDDLRLMLWVCSVNLALPARLPLVLRYVCNMDVAVIAKLMFVTSETIKKRLVRARQTLREVPLVISTSDYPSGTFDTAMTAIYLVFQEACNNPQLPLEERQRVTTFCIHLLQQMQTGTQAHSGMIHALQANLYYHLARMPTRVVSKVPVPLDEQDRNSWSRHLIGSGANHLAQALEDKNAELNVYLCEALIQHEHCRARTFAATDWHRITQLYSAWRRLTDSASVAINHATALLYVGQPNEAINLLQAQLSDKSSSVRARAHAALAYVSAFTGEQELSGKHFAEAQSQGLDCESLTSLQRQIRKLLDKQLGVTTPN